MMMVRQEKGELFHMVPVLRDIFDDVRDLLA
jgi:hypothetical protein